MADRKPITGAQAIHREIINEILADQPDAKERRLFTALREIKDLEYFREESAARPSWLAWIRFTPDAYLIDTAERNVVVYEAVNTHDISPKKFAQMVDLSWALDENDWALILVRCDRNSRTVYNVRAASIVSNFERSRAGLPDTGWYVPDWKKFTARYCDIFFGVEESPPPSPLPHRAGVRI